MKTPVKKTVSYFLQGLFALFPLIVCGYIVLIIFRAMERNLDNVLLLLPGHIRTKPFVAITVEALAAICLFFLIALFGFLVKTALGKVLVKKFDSIFDTIPGIRSIYKGSRQIINLFALKIDASVSIQPALVEYPSAGTWVIAFITGDASAALSPDNNEKHYTVFIPTTPNPTSGFLCVMPTRKIKRLDMDMEKAVKLVLTAGTVR